MNPEIKTEWLQALRSGKYEQATGNLHVVDETESKHAFCCLGVLCEIAVKHEVIPPGIPADAVQYDIIAYGEERSPQLLPMEVIKWAGLDIASPDVKVPYDEDEDIPEDEEDGYFEPLAELNDNGMTFIEIADLIEASL